MRKTLLVILALVTFKVTSWAFPPPAGQASDCAPYAVIPAGDSLLDDDGNPTGWVGLTNFSEGPSGYSFLASCDMHWACHDSPTGISCYPCFNVYLFRDNAYDPVTNNRNVAPQWVNMNKPQSYFQDAGPRGGACGYGGQYTWDFLPNSLTRGRYLIYAEWGAGDDRRCYILRSSWLIVYVL